MARPFEQVPKPLYRSALRRRLGRRYYTWRRWLQWQLPGRSYARAQAESLLSEKVFAHRSLLLRPLKDVDMVLQHNKVTNLRLALAPLAGLLIQPGETFSLWQRVGKPTARKGYLPGLTLNQGQIEQSTGGGLCQLGNLLHWMALHSPLQVTERYRHGFDVFPDINRKIPFGSGATLAYNYIDLQIHNPTDQPYQWHLWLSEEYLEGELRTTQAPKVTYEVYEAEHRIHHEPWGGYTRHNLLHRKTLDARTGEELVDEPIVENHAVMMYNPLLPAYEPRDFVKE